MLGTSRSLINSLLESTKNKFSLYNSLKREGGEVEVKNVRKKCDKQNRRTKKLEKTSDKGAKSCYRYRENKLRSRL